MSAYNRDPNTEVEEGSIKVDGFAQVLAMLQIADDEFRESILRRLAARDPRLAANLRSDLKRMGL